MQNQRGQIIEMLHDMRKAPILYQPSRYWERRVKRFARWLLQHDINDFRKYDAPLQSFGGGAMRLADQEYQQLEKTYYQSFLLKAINAILLEVGARCPGLRISINLCLPSLHLRHMAHLGKCQQAVFLSELTRGVSETPELLKFSDRCIGNPSDAVAFKGNVYTPNFFAKLCEYFIVKRHIDFGHVKSILEIGPGYGAQLEIILRDNAQIKAGVVEIPPQLYLTQQYLEACFPGQVCTYHEAKRIGVARAIRNFRIVCLAPWQIEEIPDQAFEMFWNQASMQEMTPDIVKNYAMHIQRATSKFLYILNSVKGDEHLPLAVRTHTSYDEYIRFFDQFELQWLEDHQGHLRGIFIKR